MDFGNSVLIWKLYILLRDLSSENIFELRTISLYFWLTKYIGINFKWWVSNVNKNKNCLFCIRFQSSIIKILDILNLKCA